MRIVLMVAVLLGLTRTANAQFPFPPPPSPPPVSLPDCPKVSLGVVDGIYYWLTEDCATLDEGLGQSNGPRSVPCCSSMTPGECDCPVGVGGPMASSAGGGAAAPAASQSPDENREMQKDAADRDLAAVIAECRAEKMYLEKLESSPEIRSGNAMAHKERITGWRQYLAKVQTYLEDTTPGGDDDATKIRNFDTIVRPKGEQHRENWSRASIAHGHGKPQWVDDLQQPNAPKPAGSVTFVPDNAKISFRNGPILKVQVNQLAGGPKAVYFKTFIVYDDSVVDDRKWTQIGIQVQDPGPGQSSPGRFIDRHNFGHMVRSVSSGTTFLVVSHDPLEIER